MRRSLVARVAPSLVTVALAGGCAPAEPDAASSEASEIAEAAANAPPPPMGWSSWNRFGCDIDEPKILGQAEALVASGLSAAGYDTVNVDDCWQGPRDASGRLTADRRRFPSGMKALGDRLHALGLKFGLYTAIGDVTCALRPGSFGREDLDARTFAEWGVDTLKVDWCWHAGALEAVGALRPAEAYARFKAALDRAGRPIALSIASMGTREAVAIMPERNVGEWAPALGETWRVGGDITNDWTGVVHGLAGVNDWAAAVTPGHYADPDSLQIGNGALSIDESRAHLSMWAVAGAPLVLGNDLRAMTPATRDLLANRAVVAIDQDARRMPGTKVRELPGGVELWAKPLSGTARRAVAIFNPTAREARASVSWDAVGLAPRSAAVRDVWAGGPPRSATGWDGIVPSHAVVLLDVRGALPDPPRGDAWVSDLTATYAANYFGLVERDASVGSRRSGERRPLRIGGETFAKGLGVHAPSVVKVYLGRACERFEATVGLDDEALAAGSVVFEIRADGALLRSIAVAERGQRVAVSADVRGRAELELRARAAGATAFDHADWGSARVRCDP